ncbi:MAG: hypothetical protein E7497_04700 [Ruminococcus sp.]|nr:hypothetical protein [Ruminococcus sp.]
MIPLILFGLSYFRKYVKEEDWDDFQRLYYKYRNLMMHEAMRIIGRKAVAEECVSEAFLKIAINQYNKNKRERGDVSGDDCIDARDAADMLKLYVDEQTLDKGIDAWDYTSIPKL